MKTQNNPSYVCVSLRGFRYADHGSDHDSMRRPWAIRRKRQRSQRARAPLGENFRPTTPANEGDAAVILDWLRSG